MGPRKGLSFDEKRERLLEIFTETADFFTLKELEKIAPKRKGIVSQSVKEVLQSLVDDSLVNTDKCGVQTVFWSLPSEASQKRRVKLEELKNDIAAKQSEEEELTKTIQELEKGREETEERMQILASVEQQEARLKEVDTELARFAEFDPEEIEKMSADTVKIREAVNRWTDNIFNCQSWASNKFGMEKKQLAAQFDIPEDLDYIEE